MRDGPGGADGGKGTAGCTVPRAPKHARTRTHKQHRPIGVDHAGQHVSRRRTQSSPFILTKGTFWFFSLTSFLATSAFTAAFFATRCAIASRHSFAPFPVLPSSPKRPDMPDQRSLRGPRHVHTQQTIRVPPRTVVSFISMIVGQLSFLTARTMGHHLEHFRWIS